MTESKQEQVVEAEYTEMDKAEQEGPKVSAQVLISVMDNGQLDVSVPEGAPELKSVEIEAIARQVSDQLRDMRVAAQALELFKSKLSF